MAVSEGQDRTRVRNDHKPQILKSGEIPSLEGYVPFSGVLRCLQTGIMFRPYQQRRHERAASTSPTRSKQGRGQIAQGEARNGKPWENAGRLNQYSLAGNTSSD